MDTITHGLSGALIGRALSKRAKLVTPRAYMATGALAAIFPDFDFVLKIFGGDFYTVNHRGITHSLLFLPLWSILVAFLMIEFFALSKKPEKWFQSLDRQLTRREIFKDIYLVTILSMLSHIVGDLITSYGTMIFWPIKNRYEFGSVFIIDLFFTGIIILGLVLSFKYGKNIIQKSKIATISLLVLMFYIGLTQCLKIEAKSVMENRVYSKFPETIKQKNVIFDAKAQMLLPTNWTGIAYNPKDEVYYFSKINLLNKSKEEIEIYKKWGSKNSDRAKAAWQHPQMDSARNFLQYPYLLSENDNCVNFSDMRFKMPNFNREPFIFSLCKQ